MLLGLLPTISEKLFTGRELAHVRTIDHEMHSRASGVDIPLHTDDWQKLARAVESLSVEDREWLLFLDRDEQSLASRAPTEWVDHEGDNALAYAMLARQQCNGLTAFGAAETEQETATLRRLCEAAARTTERSLELHPNAIAIADRFFCALFEEEALDDGEASTLVDLALRIAPTASVPIWMAILSRTQMWGGSHDSMHALADRITRGLPDGSPLWFAKPLAHVYHWQYWRDFDERQMIGTYWRSPQVRGDICEAFDRSIGSPAFRQTPLTWNMAAPIAMALAQIGDTARLPLALAVAGCCDADTDDIHPATINPNPWALHEDGPRAGFAAACARVGGWAACCRRWRHTLATR